ncbi:hybrid sensor histidine kinase/response regulator [Luteimonas sp. MC1782]|uniref:hybrid sensor histidine kinase/response regulator n=1 Tax=Luteimonas sp. MC1782 TaxID=2760305 RepID=UPI0016015E06|nr:hybrid sensor histidine kinase/response regulator [Luteimonas sp. MC1782]MBB1473297.1 hybrid sensor histidine kinase/response regulator [Luteimonas sp. MC1782]
MPTGFTAQGRVLVVDDQQANLRVVSALLARHGYEVAVADNGPAALAMVEAQVPDLVLLDMMMPGMDGFGVMAEIRERALLRVPVVFLTAAQDRELLLRAFGAGAVDYVTKPFIPEELMARVNAHVGLKLARDRLERVARERQELVNLVAHDLKNPLSSVVFASDMLLADSVRPERVPRYLQMIRDSAEDGLGYIRRYLETQAQARSQAERPVDARASLGDVVDWIMGRYALQFEDRGCQLRAAPVGNAVVAMDAVVLRQVAENLVSNAMKYAPGSDVELSAPASAPGYWQLRVEDRGPGIPGHRQRELFRPFVRLAHDDPAIAGASSGLGLSLAKQIVSGAGGQLWYEDREGGGACFVIELPEAATA